MSPKPVIRRYSRKIFLQIANLTSDQRPVTPNAKAALAKKMLAWARTELAGAYLIAPFKRYEEILEIFS